MSEPFLAEVKIVSFVFAPRGWAVCNGQLLPINQNQALFSLLGTTYGGDGRTNFALPDLRGRTPMHFGSGFALGEKSGEESHTLIIGETPAHNHTVRASSNAGALTGPTNAFWASTTSNPYSGSSNAAMAPGALSNVGGSQPHPNMPPYLAVSFIIALQGIFPSQN